MIELDGSVDQVDHAVPGGDVVWDVVELVFSGSGCQLPAPLAPVAGPPEVEGLDCADRVN